MSWRALFRRHALLGFVLVFMASLSAQDPSIQTDSSDAFVGTWQAQFQGQAFLTIKLAMQDGKLTGTISRATVQFDQDGALTSAQTQDGQDAASDLSITGKILHLTQKGGDSQEKQFEMELAGSGQADLRLLASSTDSTAPKPWKLAKVTDSSAASQQTASTQSKPQDIKSKLAAAAQSWLAGQFGTGSPASASSTAGSSATSAGSTSTGSGASSATPALKLSDAQLDSSLRKSIDNLPRRVRDQFNNQGDMVNFVIVGSQEQMQAALTAANWHVADTDDKQAAVKAVLETYQRKDYLEMPMSTLYLFDRKQDYGYEEADAYAVVATRHHFRIWKAPFTYSGQTVWVGAGTHDIGFEKDQRNGNVTHKIDPAVDGERDNIGQTIQQAGKVKSLAYYLPPNPVQDAKNATGGGYHSDGRILVIFLE